MSHLSKIIAVLLITVATYGCEGFAWDNPPKDDKAQQLVGKMVEAHGGDAWTSAPSVHFGVVMFLAGLPIGDGRTYEHNWRYYKVTVNPRTGVGYVELPTTDREGPALAFDGKEIWSYDYELDPVFNDDPFTLTFFHYSLIGIPWSTDLPGVELEYVGKEAGVPNDTKEYEVVKMTFNPVGKKHEGYFKLFIDPETFLLRGFEQTSDMPMLPANILPNEIGLTQAVMYRITDSYVEVEGVTMPRVYTTYMLQEDGTHKMVGSHMITEQSLTKTISDSDVKKPSSGVNVVYTKGG